MHIQFEHIEPEPWSPGEPSAVGQRVAVPNKLSIIDRLLMAFGARRRSPEYRLEVNHDE